MQRNISLLLILITFLSFASLTYGESSAKIKVVATIFPLADLAKNVGGDRIEVITLLPPGASPHTFDPTPKQVEKLAEAHLLVQIGAGLDDWAAKLVKAAANPDLVIIETSEKIELIKDEEHHTHTGGNPHIWLDPIIAKKIVSNIGEALKEIDPRYTSYYEENTSEYLAELDRLDQEIKERISKFKIKDFVSFHSAFIYFAKRYGLNQAAVIEEFPGKEPTPKYLAEVLKVIKDTGVKAVFAEPQLNPKTTEVVASESGVELLFLDPLGDPETPERNTYIKLIRYNVGVMEQVMR